MKNFKCLHCGELVKNDHLIGTQHRNHCPYCLWSFHVDDKKDGDRLSKCKGQMSPTGLTFKNEGKDKYGKIRIGELMVIHKCQKCGKISINRIAADDDSKTIQKLFKSSADDQMLRTELETKNIRLLDKTDEEELKNQLFGK